MIKYYRFIPKLKNQMLRKWLNSQRKYKGCRMIAYIFYTIGYVVFACFVLLFVVLSLDLPADTRFTNILLGIGAGFILGFIPWIIGNSIHNKAQKEYGRPYCRMKREFLYSDDEGIQFGYSNTENKYTASMDVYQILYKDITGIRFDERFNMVYIRGEGALIVYDDYANGRIHHALSDRRFYSDTEYSFILAFEEQEEFINLVKQKMEEC